MKANNTDITHIIEGKRTNSGETINAVVCIPREILDGATITNWPITFV